MYYDENDICQKCGKKLESHIVDYKYAHDMGIFYDSYKKIDRNSAKNIFMGRFYCSDCYSKIGDNKTTVIVDKANKYLNTTLSNAVKEVEEHYKFKIQQLKDIEEYIKKCISFLETKENISELSKEEIEMLLKRSYVYKPNFQEIQIGFCDIKELIDVEELYKQKYK